MLPHVVLLQGPELNVILFKSGIFGVINNPIRTRQKCHARTGAHGTRSQAWTKHIGTETEILSRRHSCRSVCQCHLPHGLGRGILAALPHDVSLHIARDLRLPVTQFLGGGCPALSEGVKPAVDQKKGDSRIESERDRGTDESGQAVCVGSPREGKEEGD
jgi:hypothetical protein